MRRFIVEPNRKLYRERSEANVRQARWLTRNWRELWSYSRFMLPAQFIDCLLADSLKHVRPRLLNDVLSDYWLLIIVTNGSWQQRRLHTKILQCSRIWGLKWYSIFKQQNKLSVVWIPHFDVEIVLCECRQIIKLNKCTLD